MSNETCSNATYLLTTHFVCVIVKTMMKLFLFIMFYCLICGCAGRQSAITPVISEKNNKYIFVSFDFNEKELVGKSKSQIKEILGEPLRVQKNTIPGSKNEVWIYCPKATKNFIAIIVLFDKDKVKCASYESVLQKEINIPKFAIGRGE